MDMRISIESGKYETFLYEKPLALHLYLPPHSAHPPGVITGLVMGNVLRIYQLCSREQDIEQELVSFYGHLRNRGYQDSTLSPLFDKAIANAVNYISTPESVRLKRKSDAAEQARRRVFFHLQYHPQNPPSREIQRLWREHVAYPPGEKPLNELIGAGNTTIPIDQLVVAYSRGSNLGELFSYQKIGKLSGSNKSPFN